MRHIILFLISSQCFANSPLFESHASGLFRVYEAGESHPTRETEAHSIDDFQRNQFPFLGNRHAWKEISHVQDNTHSHRIFALYYEGRRVVGQYLKTHFNPQGFIEYASSSVERRVEGFVTPISQGSQVFWKEKLKTEFETRFNRPLKGGIQSEPVIFVDSESGELHSALEMHLVNDSPLYVRHVILDEMTGRVLSEKRSFRTVDTSGKIFKVSPFGSATADSVTLTTDSVTKLSNSYFYVRREENVSSPTLVDIAPADYSASIQSNPASYDPTCKGASTACADQSFDGVNVYYHLSQFRTRIGSYLTELGASVTFTGEPIPVIVNTLTLGGYTYDELSNNAQYVTGCRSDGSMPRCMVFLRPARLSADSSLSACGSSSLVQLHDLARESLVIAHEYQHYVTDTITHIVFGCDSNGNNCAVGDAIHEAISDYLAATYVSDVAGRDVTLVGEYGLQNCTPLQRQLNTLKVFQNTTAEQDSHVAGLTWASGYWKLKTEFGTAVVDKILIKSLFYLPVAPSFSDTVESLVKADTILNAGAHVTRIRQLFYTDLNIFASKPGLFRDPSSGLVEMGTRGCSSVSYPMGAGSALASFFSFWVWLGATLWVGRRGRKH